MSGPRNFGQKSHSFAFLSPNTPCKAIFVSFTTTRTLKPVFGHLNHYSRTTGIAANGQNVCRDRAILDKMIHFWVYLEERKFEARMRKRRAAFVLSPGLFFSPRNIKTQFEGNFFNRRLLKFPENCVLMFRGQNKKAWAKYKTCPSFLNIR